MSEGGYQSAEELVESASCGGMELEYAAGKQISLGNSISLLKACVCRRPPA